MGRILIYTCEGSIICSKLRSLLKSLLPNKKIAFYDISLTNHPERFEEMKKLTSKESVPQIFFNRTHIGGYKEFKAYMEKHIFSKEIVKIMRADSPSTPTLPEDSIVNTADIKKVENQVSTSQEILINKLRNIMNAIKKDSLRLNIKEKKRKNILCQTFKGAILQKYIKSYQEVVQDTTDSTELINSLIQQKFIINETETTDKFNAKHNYSIYKNWSNKENNPYFWCLNTDCEIQTRQIEPVNYSIELRRLVGVMQNNFINKDGNIMLEDLKKSGTFHSYINKILHLSKLEIKSLGNDELKVFFINIYNCMAFHFSAEKGFPKGSDDSEFYTRYCYSIAGEIFTLIDIHNLLRCNPNQIGSFGNMIPYSCDLDTRIHFALESHSADFSSYLYLFRKENLAESLNLQTRIYLTNMVEYDKEKKKVNLPKLFKTYFSDFGGTVRILLDTVSIYYEPMKTYLSTGGVDELEVLFDNVKLDHSSVKLGTNVKAMLPVLNIFNQSFMSGSVSAVSLPVIDDYQTKTEKISPHSTNDIPKIRNTFQVDKGFHSYRSSLDNALPKMDSFTSISPKVNVKSINLSINVEDSQRILKYTVKSNQKVWDLKTMMAFDFIHEGYQPYHMILKKSKLLDFSLVNDLEFTHEQNKVIGDTTLHLSFDTTKKKIPRMSSAVPKYCFCVGRSLKYVVSGEQSSFVLHFSDNNTNKCNVSKNLEFTFKRNCLLIDNQQYDMQWKKSSVACHFKIHLSKATKEFYSVDVRINGELCKEYNFVVLDFSPEHLKKYLKEEDCLEEILNKMERMTNSDIEKYIGVDELIQIIFQAEEKKIPHIQLSILTVMTKYLESAENKIKFLEVGKLESISSLILMVDMVNSTKEIKVIPNSYENILSFLGRIMCSHANELTEELLLTNVELRKTETTFERKNGSMMNMKLRKSSKVDYPKDYTNYLDLFVSTMVHLLNTKSDFCIEYSAKLLYILSTFSQGADKILVLQKLNLEFFNLFFVNSEVALTYTLMAIFNLTSNFSEKFIPDEKLMGMISNNVLKGKLDTESKKIALDIFYSLASKNINNFILFSNINDIFKNIVSLLQHIKIDFLYQKEASIFLLNNINSILKNEQSVIFSNNSSPVKKSVLSTKKTEDEEFIIKILSFINAVVNSKVKRKIFVVFSNDNLGHIFLELLRSDNETIISQTWKFLTNITDKDENLIFKSLSPQGKDDFYGIFEKFCHHYMKNYGTCNFYGIDFSPFFLCSEMKISMTILARDMIRSDLKLRKSLTIAFGQAFIGSYIDLITNDKFIFNNVMKTLHIEKNSLTFGKIVGKGVAGIVHLGTFNKEKVAIKTFNQDSLSFNEKEYLSELAIMDIAKHNNLVHLVGACSDSSDIYLVSPFYDFGSLIDVIFEKKLPITLKRRVRMALEIARGIKFLHSMNIIHRDVKTANVLVDRNFKVALTDFGVSRLVNPLNMSRGVGTPLYCSPEVLEGTKYTLKADTYSYSIVLYELFYRKIPFEDKNLMKIQNDIIYNDLRPTFPPLTQLDYKELDSSSPLQKLIVSCWNNLPSHRPSFVEIVDILKKEIVNIKSEDEKIPLIDN